MNKPIKTIAEFHEQLPPDKSDSRVLCLYRGQSNEIWPVDCSAARRLDPNPQKPGSENSIDPSIITYPLIQYTESLIRKVRMRGVIPTGVSEALPMMETLAQLQHYGAATGLIDFTRQPLVALWFACRGTSKKNGAVHILRLPQKNEISDHETLEGKNIKSIYESNELSAWEPSRVDNRVVAQRSVFVFGKPRIPSTDMTTIIVCSKAKDTIISDLEFIYGINEEELFADLSGYSKANAASSPIDHKQTIRDLEGKIELSDKHEKATAHFNLGSYYAYEKLDGAKQQNEKWKQAIKQYDKAIKLNPKYAEAYYGRGLANFNLHQGEEEKSKWFKKSIEDYTEAIRLDPEYVRAYVNRSVAKESLKEDGAIADIEKALRLAEEHELSEQIPRIRELLELLKPSKE